MARLKQLIVCAAAHRLRFQQWNGLVIQNAAESARDEDITLVSIHLVRAYWPQPVLTLGALDARGVQVRADDDGALSLQVGQEVIPDFPRPCKTIRIPLRSSVPRGTAPSQGCPDRGRRTSLGRDRRFPRLDRQAGDVPGFLGDPLDIRRRCADVFRGHVAAIKACDLPTK